MNLGEMVDEVMDFFPRELQQADVINRLNRAQKREARDLGIPSYYTEVTGVTGAFSLPSGARPEWLLEVRRNEDGTRFPVYTSQEADLKYPGWKEWDRGSTVCVVFDPKMSGASGVVTPVPLPKSGETEDYYVTYVGTPTAMSSLTDEPWDGSLETYHDLLVKRVLYELFMAIENQAWQVHYQEYQRLRDHAFRASQPRVLHPNNLVYKAVQSES